MTNIIRRTAAVAAFTLIALPIATPAFAKAKPIVITLPANTLKDPASKICMPKSVMPKPVDAALPNTVCQTQEDWTAKGVTLRAR